MIIDSLIRAACRLLSLVLLAGLAEAKSEFCLPLTGEWNFTLDPLGRGEQLGWARPNPEWDGTAAHPVANWDRVQVPHDYLSDPRYVFTGTAWYRRSFSAPAVGAEGTPRVWRLQFDTVFQRCRVWLNGEYVGAHEGGYTPFEFTVTERVRPGGWNFLVVEVDNGIRLRALPGVPTSTKITSQIYPWLNYGGILGEVRLVANAPVFVSGRKIEALPDPAGGAAVKANLRLRNDGAGAMHVRWETAIQREDGTEVATLGLREAVLPPNSETTVSAEGELPASAVRLWSLDEPRLYVARTTVRDESGAVSHMDTCTFGIRRIEAREGRLWLNGEPISLPGANRSRGHPVHGGFDPDELVEADLRQMKEARLELARLQHTPPGRNLLDWADRHGLLLILEVGNWGYTSPDLASVELRAQFRREMAEMMELAWNHPSVVGWSIGNEYESWTTEGVAWTRDMSEWVRQRDATRLVTFAALGGALREFHATGETGGFEYVDIIGLNLYMATDKMPPMVDPLHERFPDKPVLVTEFGLRADRVKDEQERIDHFERMKAFALARPWICGLSFWAFNDYRSRYPGSGPDGYRNWGLVDAERRPRDLHRHLVENLRPVSVQARRSPAGLEVELKYDGTWPARVLRDQRVRLHAAVGGGGVELVVTELRPGQSLRVTLPVAVGEGAIVEVCAHDGVVSGQGVVH